MRLPKKIITALICIAVAMTAAAVCVFAETGSSDTLSGSSSEHLRDGSSSVDSSSSSVDNSSSSEDSSSSSSGDSSSSSSDSSSSSESSSSAEESSASSEESSSSSEESSSSSGESSSAPVLKSSSESFVDEDDITNAQTILEDENETGVKIAFQQKYSGLKLVVNTVQHTSEAYAAITEAAAGRDILLCYDITVEGKYSDSDRMTVVLPIDGNLNGRTLAVMHYKNGVVESFNKTVISGCVKLKVDGLSVFAVTEVSEFVRPEKSGNTWLIVLTVAVIAAALVTGGILVWYWLKYYRGKKR